MTILENLVLTAIRTIASEKEAAGQMITHTLVVHDNLHKRVQALAEGQELTSFEVSSALITLQQQGHIHIGPTINDTYITTKKQQEDETMEKRADILG